MIVPRHRIVSPIILESRCNFLNGLMQSVLNDFSQQIIKEVNFDGFTVGITFVGLRWLFCRNDR